VTIGVAFNCHEGIVICSDTQMSTGSMKFYENKIETYYINRSATPCCIAVTYAGDLAVFKSFWDRFCAKLKSDDEIASPPKVKVALEDTLAAMNLLDGQGYPTLYLLCGATQSGHLPILLKCQGDTVHTVTAVDFVGSGDSSVIRYLSRMLYLQNVGDVSSAIKLGTYVVGQAKLYVDGCGGDTDIVLLSADGKIMHLGALPYLLEKVLGNIEVYMLTMLSAARAPEVKQEEFDDIALEFVNHLTEFTRKDVFDFL
jgi:hypothetical protein